MLVKKLEAVQLPKATAKRLPLYYRYLKTLEDSGVKRIKSKEFSALTQVPSTTIRRDFSHFGELGRSGYGYDVDHVIEVFDQILNVNKLTKVAIVGVGNLGKALLANNFRRDENLKIACGFEKDETQCGEVLSGIPIYSIDKMAEIIQEEGINTAISTVPSKYSQEAINSLVAAGVTAILNFAPGRVSAPPEVDIRYIDLTTELLTLIYFNEHLREKVEI